MYYKGKFVPRNPQKYGGDVSNIIYRSSWEARLMRYFDTHESIISWHSEETVILYESPIDGKIHRYFTDFKVKMRDRNGKISTVIIEVKPSAQTKPPKIQKRKTKRYIEEVQRYGINEAKWEAAKSYCKKRGWEFHIVTEKDLFG